MIKGPKKRQAKLAVLEAAEWWSGDTFTSTKPSFQMLEKLTLRNKDAYFIHSTFFDEDSFKATFRYYTRRYGVKYIYISCHGSPKALHCPDSSDISYREFKHCLKQEKGLVGVFVGACEFVEKSAEVLIGDQSDSSPIKWIAGYRDEADWILSSAFDVLFWSKILDEKPKSQTELIEFADSLKKQCGGLMTELKFSFFINKRGDILDLITNQSLYT